MFFGSFWLCRLLFLWSLVVLRSSLAIPVLTRSRCRAFGNVWLCRLLVLWGLVALGRNLVLTRVRRRAFGGVWLRRFFLLRDLASSRRSLANLVCLGVRALFLAVFGFFAPLSCETLRTRAGL